MNHIVRIVCTHVLHPADSYMKQQTEARYGPDYIPLWPDEDAPLHWCARCTTDEGRRLGLAKRRAEYKHIPHAHSLRVLHPAVNRVHKPKRRMGDRFVTLNSQTIYANKHAPPGLRWCQWGFHYAPQNAFVCRAESYWVCMWDDVHRCHYYGVKAGDKRRAREAKLREQVEALKQERTRLHKEIQEARALLKMLDEQLYDHGKPRVPAGDMESVAAWGDVAPLQPAIARPRRPVKRSYGEFS